MATIEDDIAATGHDCAVLTSTLVAGNRAATGGPDVSGSVLATSAYNLIGDGSDASGLTDGINGNQVGTAVSPINPLLGPLQDNGGPTQTRALLAGSPALNAGDPAQLVQVQAAFCLICFNGSWGVQ